VTSLCPMFWYGDVLRNSQFSRRVYVAHISLFASSPPHLFNHPSTSLSLFPSLTLLLLHVSPTASFHPFSPSPFCHQHPLLIYLTPSHPFSTQNPPPKPNQPVAIAHPTYPQTQPIPTHENPRLQETTAPIPILTLSTPATYKPYIHKPIHPSPYKPLAERVRPR